MVKEKTDRDPLWNPVCLASLSGFEPLTFRLGGGGSILLSYRDKP